MRLLSRTKTGEYRYGNAPDFLEARAGFEAAWRVFSSTRTEADYRAWRDRCDWTARCAMQDTDKMRRVRPYADPEKAARRILEIANEVPPVQGCIHSGKSTSRFCSAMAQVRPCVGMSWPSITFTVKAPSSSLEQSHDCATNLGPLLLPGFGRPHGPLNVISQLVQMLG
jgi:hypothetical protein